MWVCNFAHIETIYIRLHAQNIKTVSSCPHYHTSTRKMANYKILYKIQSLAPHKKNSDTVRWFSFVGIYKMVGTYLVYRILDLLYAGQIFAGVLKK